MSFLSNAISMAEGSLKMRNTSRANFGRTGLSGPVRDRPERLLLYPPIISVDKYENAVSPYGVFQMAGNVAEWVSDWYVIVYLFVSRVPQRRRSSSVAARPIWTDATSRAWTEDRLSASCFSQSSLT